MSPLARVFRGAIRLYQRLPRLRPPVCRFGPTCSYYGIEAIDRHGAFKGTWLAIRRVGRCHPWGGSGWDPVPGTQEDPHLERALDEAASFRKKKVNN